MKHVISLGAGVQSSTMALMASHCEIEPMPELAIFADTGWEPKRVYEWLNSLEKWLTFPVVRVQKGNLRAEQVSARVRGHKADGDRWASLPYFTYGENGTGKVKRQCTSEYKIQPIEFYLRRTVMGLAKGQRASRTPVITQWRGISIDEASRMKPSREPWMIVRYPLAMEHSMSRHDCLIWMQRHGYPEPPRSACIGCPFHHNDEWRRMKIETPDEFQDAVEFDAAIRKAGGMRGETFLHRSCKPLGEIDFSNDVDRGQRLLSDWVGECEGMCGL